MDKAYKKLFEFNKGIALETLLCAEGVRPGAELDISRLDKSKFLNLIDKVKQDLPAIGYQFVDMPHLCYRQLFDNEFEYHMLDETEYPTSDIVRRKAYKYDEDIALARNIFKHYTQVNESYMDVIAVRNFDILLIYNTELVDNSFLEKTISGWADIKLDKGVHELLGKFFGTPDCCISAFLSNSETYDKDTLFHSLCRPDCKESERMEDASKKAIEKVWGAPYVELLNKRYELIFT